MRICIGIVLLSLFCYCHAFFSWPWKRDLDGNKGTAGKVETMPSPYLAEGGADSLHMAAALGDISSLEHFILQEMDINSKDANGWQPIHEAVKHGDVKVVKFLVGHGARVEDRTQVGGTPLWWSLHQYGEAHPISIYLRSIDAPLAGDGSDATPENADDSTDLHLFASEGNVDAAKQVLLVHRHLLSSRDANGWQPIHEAVLAGELLMVQFLVNAGAAVNDKTTKGGTALWWAKKSLGPNHPVTIYLESIGALDESDASD